ncbi:hypothetical protein UFOVP1071_122 [uncultured Caudovirales phage]|uniref:Uncharacterized protein n=1 Tax=uncultured Caudovirales phage TaxID=2100421 RepID=A0A6J5QMG2_9CAUD|nr:hypothetical protein UFOVP1071_122 [uncultured Caudovirales phage]
MKVSIGKYQNWIGPYQIADAVFFWLEKWPSDELEHRWDYKLHDKFGDWLVKTWVNDFCQWIYSKNNRKIKIHIDKYDTWGMDHTLSLIIVPMLKQLKATKHGCPLADSEDAPHIDSGYVDPNDGSDSLIEERWNWILGEMIWVHEQIIDEDSDKNYYVPYKEDEKPEVSEALSEFITQKDMLNMGRFDKEKFDAYEARIQNGLRLFGKYYRSLWD